ncbi:acyl-ACP--UDP-N-acetylglucosamine O-acyltransferase [Brucella haematophila]|jgi:UDP-N-acetylglucosamine acyltransferase|uniref:Acyl-[acyl-carrier-protein]--UDP-N-acetylglucosamine O-acyltransferase n=1 Tax=Brucella haematophila TaxID=419474 RepID=A0ABX1DIC7_9HYPH|nr:acyl-ACP--UDP-N-acetylglucosamine O-acyltransferase [Brucella haematophila]NKC02729.1 acyl-ACP--UDP-N-acetylglucosamine O-acyltransferase [Brucella haematophila]TMU92213.1 acyl-ACP--UDP-N-acetylglucosamine O-acyltransferase [Brucella haematophila]
MKETIIHPTALVEPGVELGQGVSVGPFCHIQSGAVIGDNSVLMSHVVVTGGTTLGAGAKVYPHAVLGCDPQNGKHKGGPTTLTVGANCLIREGVTMHRGSDSARGYTSVGSDCTFLAYAHVAHDCDVGDHVTFSNNVMIGGHTTIEHHAILGGGAAVHQFVRVGHHAFVGGMAGVVGDVIPYGMVIGNHAHLGGLNIVGMKRSGMQRAEIHMLRHAVRMLFDRTKPVRDRAADVLAAFPESQAVADMIAFISVDAKRAYTTPPLDAAHGGVGHDSDES